MKIFNSIFLAFIAIFASQNANAGDTVYCDNPLNESYVLWRVQFWQDPLRPTIKNYAFKSHIEIDSLFIGKIDSVLRGDFFVDEKWRFHLNQKEMEKFNIKRNTGYLILAKPIRLKYGNVLDIPRKEDIFPDTPENRKKLSKKWDETIIIYKNPPSDPKEWFDPRYRKYDSTLSPEEMQEKMKKYFKE